MECVKTVSDKVVRHSLAYNYPCKNDWWRDPFYLKFSVKVTTLERNRRFSIYFRSRLNRNTLAKKVQLTLIRSLLGPYALSKKTKMNMVRCP